MVRLAENRSRLARKIRFQRDLHYRTIEALAPGLEIDLLDRFIDLEGIRIDEAVSDVERFLRLLKKLNNKIVKLCFLYSNQSQPQQLFDRLFDHCAIQCLKIWRSPADLQFLFSLKSLNSLTLHFFVDLELIAKLLDELPFLTFFRFKHFSILFTIRIDHYPKKIAISFTNSQKETDRVVVLDANAAIQWIRLVRR